MLGNLFNKSSFGLDLSDESLKFVELVPGRGGLRLGKHGECEIPPGVIEMGAVKDPKQMTKILSSLKKDLKIKSAHVSLQNEYGQHLEDYLRVFKKSGISVKSLESHPEAISRSILRTEDKNSYLVVDFSKKNSTIFIVSGGVVASGSSLSLGGDTMTDIIGKKLGINFKEAEKARHQYGLERNAKNQEIVSGLLEAVTPLADEIKKHFVLWHSRKREGDKYYSPITEIILCGRDSYTLGLAEYLAVSTKNKVRIANVWINILDPGEEVPEMPFQQSPAFASALGVALKGFY